MGDECDWSTLFKDSIQLQMSCNSSRLIYHDPSIGWLTFYPELNDSAWFNLLRSKYLAVNCTLDLKWSCPSLKSNDGPQRTLDTWLMASLHGTRQVWWWGISSGGGALSSPVGASRMLLGANLMASLDLKSRSKGSNIACRSSDWEWRCRALKLKSQICSLLPSVYSSAIPLKRISLHTALDRGVLLENKPLKKDTMLSIIKGGWHTRRHKK